METRLGDTHLCFFFFLFLFSLLHAVEWEFVFSPLGLSQGETRRVFVNRGAKNSEIPSLFVIDPPP